MSSPYPVLHGRPIDQWKVTELKDELRRRRFSTSGLKQDLINRLNESIAQEEIANGSKSDTDIQNTSSDGRPDLPDDIQSEEYPMEVTENKVVNDEIDSNVVNDDKEEHFVDAEHTIKAPDEDIVTTTDLNIAVEEVHPSVSMEANVVDAEDIEQISAIADSNNKSNDVPEEKIVENDDEIMSNEQDSNTKLQISEHAEVERKNGLDEEIMGINDTKRQISENTEGEERTIDALDEGIMENNDAKIQISEHAEDEERKRHEGQDEEIVGNNDKKNNGQDKDTKLSNEDVNHNETELNNQVSEVKPDLGFPVHCESISTDSVSINEKNELKDNLNADNFPLELDVIKPEIVHQSSSDVTLNDGGLHPGDNVGEPVYRHDLSERMDHVSNASYGDLDKKNDSVDGGLDGGYSEKLNLDRSSGDESMEEDLLENKQVDSSIIPEVVKNRVEVEEETIERAPQLIDGVPHREEDAVSKDEKKSIVIEKRKLEERESHGPTEPVKRQRRWNTEAPKAPEQKHFNLPSLGTPTGSSQTTPKHIFVRSDSTLSQDTQEERVVPPSQKPPTNSLRIDRFLRPFTLKALQDMLSKTGAVSSFWMDTIKTHCYVTYSSEQEAVETRNAVYNLQWPPNGGRLLIAEFVDPQEVIARLEAPSEAPVPISPAATPTSNQTTAQHPSRQHAPRQQLPPPPSLPPPPPLLSQPPQAKERLPPPSPLKRPEPPILTLDDLFKKTKTTPRIYYLPLSEEEVTAKKATQLRNSRV